MYLQFFRLRENPFKLAPNLAYFYLSSEHEEALAHLNYGISEGEGFICITGKAGVGKTLTCMQFIASLKEKTEVAYISNPILGSDQLLKTVCRKFKFGADKNDTKDFLNAFYSFLMGKRLSGKRVVLFIDEAQKLERNTLEQIRLLSNLETNRTKLLQIVLVGQPELTETLNSNEFRQIGQRISVSYYINPLTSFETPKYIFHRLNIASRGASIQFEKSVFRHIIRYSSGIPRLINIACDKVLLTSYTYSQRKILGDTAKIALVELRGRTDRKRWIDYLSENQSKLILVGCCIGFLAVGYIYTKLISSTADFNHYESNKISTFQLELPNLYKSGYWPWKKEKLPRVAKKSSTSNEAKIATGIRLTPQQKVTREAHDTSNMTHSVQIGAFLNKENAERIRSIFRKKGYDSRIVIFTDPKNRIWHTVRIGNYPSREIAKRHAEAFTSKEKNESAVVPVNNL